MTEVFDPSLPELSARDPRLCPGRSDHETMKQTYGEAPEWVGPKSYTQAHEWPDGVRDARCRWCEASQSEVRARFSDWRYEQVIIENTRSLDRLAVAIRAGRLA